MYAYEHKYEENNLEDIINGFGENNGNVTSYMYNIMIIISNYVTRKLIFYNILESHGFIDWFNEVKVELHQLFIDFNQPNSDHGLSPELKLLAKDVTKDINNSITKNLKISVKKYVIFKLKLREKNKEISKVKISITGNSSVVDKKLTAEFKANERKKLTDIKINVFKFIYGDDYKVSL